MKFRKKPVVIEAEQFKGELIKGVCDCYSDGELHVHTAHGGQAVYLKHGDWIIPEPDGERFYPVKPDIFQASYERVED